MHKRNLKTLKRNVQFHMIHLVSSSGFVLLTSGILPCIMRDCMLMTYKRNKEMS